MGQVTFRSTNQRFYSVDHVCMGHEFNHCLQQRKQKLRVLSYQEELTKTEISKGMAPWNSKIIPREQNKELASTPTQPKKKKKN